MNSIYIHIPFCKSVCYYCDFHFSVSLKQKDLLLAALHSEIQLRNKYLDDNPVKSIYIGGGTPSVLSIEEIETLLNKIYKYFKVSDNAEITIEVNPNDLYKSYLTGLSKIGINRLSIGVQSFFDEELKWMNRRHTGKEAEECVKLSQDAGFNNINIDILYGLPISTNNNLFENLKKFETLQIPHLSAYHLTIEPKTVFGYRKRKGTFLEIDEEKSINQYSILTTEMQSAGYKHYEISNFCKDDVFSKHNLNYWNQGKYIGIGPSAHSYDGNSRQWNVSVNTHYINAIEKGKPYFEEEKLSAKEKYNDYLLTGLRTMWGIDKLFIMKNFGENFLIHLEKELENFKNSDCINITNNTITLSEKGMFISDRVISTLFWV